jgi:hypothetical protein
MYVRQSGSFSFVGGSPYTVAAVVKADGFSQAYVMGYDGSGDRGAVFDLTTGNVLNAYSSPAQSAISLGGGWWMCVVNITVQASPTASLIDVRLAQGGAPGSVIGDGVKGVDLYRAALFQGTLTAQQILQCGGIPLSTSAPASSSGGNWAWQGNGSSTALNLTAGSQATSAFTVVAGIVQSAITGSQIIYGEGTNGPQFWINSAGGLILDKGAVGTLVAQASVAAAGVPMVLSGRLQAGIATLRKNGSQIASTPSALTFSSTIGSLMASNNNFWWGGLVYPVVVVPSGVSDADLLAIEKMVAVFTGPTGVPF